MKIKEVIIELPLGTSIKEETRKAIIYSLENKCNVSFKANMENYFIDYNKISNSDNYIKL